MTSDAVPDAPPLDVALIRAQAGAIARDFEAMLQPGVDLTEVTVDASPWFKEQWANGLVPSGVPLRDECQLLFDYYLWRHRGQIVVAQDALRQDIAVWVMNRHGVVDWPGWANDWIAGDGPAAL